MRQFFLERVQEESVLSGQAFMYLHYADMIANGYKRTMPCPFRTQGLLLNPNGDFFYCENSQPLGNVLDEGAEALYFKAEHLADRASFEDGICKNCLSPCQVNVGAMKQFVPYAKFLRARLQGEAEPRSATSRRCPRRSEQAPRQPLRAAGGGRRPAGLLLWKSDPADIGRIAAHAIPSWILWACALVVFDRALMAWRWLLLLGPLTTGAPPPLWGVMRIFFVSTFVGTALPQRRRRRGARLQRQQVRRLRTGGRRLGRDGPRARRGVDPAARARQSRRLQRACAVGRVRRPRARWARQPRAGPRDLLGWRRRPGVEPRRAAAGRWLRGLAQKLLDAVRAYRHHHGALTMVIVASVGVQMLRVLQCWCLGLSLGIRLPLTAYFVTVPVILLIMLLPVTINGLGTSQAAFLWCFGVAGVGRPEAFALSILFVALGIVGNLPGALLYLTSDVAPQRAEWRRSADTDRLAASSKPLCSSCLCGRAREEFSVLSVSLWRPETQSAPRPTDVQAFWSARGVARVSRTSRIT